jgi:F-type H+/Na+-transporting ATPase subunit alpha
MKFNTAEIAAVLQQEIEQFERQVDVREVGTVIEVGDGIARVYGLSNVMAGEMVEFPSGVYGLAFNLEESSVGIIILGDYLQINEGDEVKAMGRLLSVPVGDAVIGRVLDPLGNPLDGKGPVAGTQRRPVELLAPGVAERQPVGEPLQTGVKAVDAITPIGRGQRELIIGDRKTGKTAIAIDAILNQKGFRRQVFLRRDRPEGFGRGGDRRGTGKTRRDGVHDRDRVRGQQPGAAAVRGALCRHGDGRALHVQRPARPDRLRRLVQAGAGVPRAIAADASAAGPRGVSGRRVLLPQPVARTIVQVVRALGGGSLTSLPIIETLEGEVSAYIPTNVISITDGQIYLQPDLFFAGQRPAMNAGISVSRVGGAAQIKAMKKVAGGLRLDLASFRELEAFAQLGTELDAATQSRLDRGYRMVELLKQPQYQPMHVVDQVLSIYAGTRGYLDDVPVSKVRDWEQSFLSFIHNERLDLWNRIRDTQDLPRDLEAELVAAIEEFRSQFGTGS